MFKNLIQLIKVLDLLSRPQGTTKKEIKDQLTVSDKTVDRMITAVEEMGIPIYDETIPLEKQKRWRVVDSYVDKLPNLTLPKIALTYSEILAIAMMAGESVVFKGTEIDTHIQTTLAKLMYFLPSGTRRDLSNLKKIFICKTMGSKTYTGKDHIIQSLTESMLSQTACAISYHAFYKDETKEAEIGPLHFYENKGGLYLFALKITDNTIRSYAVERIRHIRKTDRHVDYPDNFDPEDRLNSAFDMIHGDPASVKIHFSKTVARYIKEKPWAKDQKLKDHDDGSLTLSMTTSGYRDVKRWVMSWGKEAELLEPEGMREEILADFEAIMRKMKKS